MQIEVIQPTFKIVTPKHFFSDFPKIIEYAGRTCYDSHHLTKKGSDAEFCRKLLKLGHASVFDHAHLTVEVQISRAASLQWVRHRLAAYSQQSQRYCKFSDKRRPKFVNNILPVGNWDLMNRGNLTEEQVITLTAYQNSIQSYMDLVDRKFPQELARGVLPNDLVTTLVATHDITEWRHIFEVRALNKHAQQEIRELMLQIFNKFNSLIPCCFDDLRIKNPDLNLPIPSENVLGEISNDDCFVSL